MSWDVILMRWPAGFSSVNDLGDALDPSPLGPRRHVVAALRDAFPEMDFKDETWGLLQGKGFSVEFNVGSEDICQGVMLHVRGNDRALEAVRRAVECLGVRALDTSTGSCIEFDRDPSLGLRQFRAYREKVVQKLGAGSSRRRGKKKARKAVRGSSRSRRN
jgi:hypothetical protein